ncbi:MAG: hypothetical protein A4E54_01127 [Pelotomaculum sp. PtaB.Bin117]|nr:MAG: hypothetical protein A4E54_01127 [Pelotomaculum sp. PtaB.Bin117]OPY60389.1 MAG: hypothetical protein A4E56_02722 [Pelotomaculum sp. PtaU1.Bin065]
MRQLHSTRMRSPQQQANGWRIAMLSGCLIHHGFTHHKLVPQGSFGKFWYESSQPYARTSFSSTGQCSNSQRTQRLVIILPILPHTGQIWILDLDTSLSRFHSQAGQAQFLQAIFPSFFVRPFPRRTGVNFNLKKFYSQGSQRTAFCSV